MTALLPDDLVGTIARRALDYGEQGDPELTRYVVTTDSGIVTARGPFDAALTETFRSIPGREWNAAGRVNLFPIEALPAVVTALDDHGYEVDAAVLAAAVVERNRQAVEAEAAAERRAASEATDADLTVPGLGGDLMPFQRAGVAYAIDRRRTIIGDEMGLGKTVQALAAVEHEQAFPVVIVCPATLKVNWKRETERWLPNRTVEILSGTSGDRRMVWADVIVVNYDVLYAWVEHLPPLRSLILDESHYAKSSGARRTKSCRELAKRVDRSGLVLALTGTAVVNRPDELVPQLQIIGRIAAFGGVREFRRRFCSHDGYGWNGSRAESDLHQLLRETCYVRRTKEQVLPELPAKRWADVAFDPSGLDLREYRAAERDLIDFLAESARRAAAPGEGDVAAESAARRAAAAEALVRLTTLRRLAATAKVPAAVEWVRDLIDSGEKVVVFGHHREAIETAAAALDAPMIIGGQSATERQAVVDRFQNDDECRAIVCSIKAAGVGLTLTAASNVAFIEQDWTPAGMSQAADRCHRIGQTDSVTAWTLIVPGTIDEKMAALLDEKRAIVDAILDGVEPDTTGEGSIVNDLLAGFLNETEF